MVPDDGPRYRAVIEIAHAADPLVMTEEDLDRDYDREIRELLARMVSRSPREMEEEVYLKREFRLCGPCRKELLRAIEPRFTSRPLRPPRRRHGRRRRPR